MRQFTLLLPLNEQEASAIKNLWPDDPGQKAIEVGHECATRHKVVLQHLVAQNMPPGAVYWRIEDATFWDGQGPNWHISQGTPDFKWLILTIEVVPVPESQTVN